MYGIFTGRMFREFGTMQECLAFAYRSLKRKYEYTIYDVYKYPADRGAQIKQDLRDDSGGDAKYIIGVCWVSESFPPQYESIGNTEKRSRTIMADGRLGPIGWIHPKHMR